MQGNDPLYLLCKSDSIFKSAMIFIYIIFSVSACINKELSFVVFNGYIPFFMADHSGIDLNYICHWLHYQGKCSVSW